MENSAESRENQSCGHKKSEITKSGKVGWGESTGFIGAGRTAPLGDCIAQTKVESKEQEKRVKILLKATAKKRRRHQYITLQTLSAAVLLQELR